MYHTILYWPEVSLNESRVCHTTLTDPKSVPIKRECLIPLLLTQIQFQLIPYHIGHPRIGSMLVHDVSIGSTIVPILISPVIGQIRGTSHESQTPWVECLSRRRMNYSSCLHVTKGYHRGRLNHSTCTQQTTRGRLNHSP